MIRALAFLAIALVASVSQAATVKFSGPLGYTNVVGADVLNITGKAFLATLETNDANGIISGQMWLSPPTVAATQQFNLSGGTIAIGPGSTTFSGISMAGGTLSFVLTQQAAGFSQADLFALQGSGGNSVLVVGGTTYIAAIAAVPEPGSMLALAGLVVGCAGVTYRRRMKKLAA